MTIADGPNGGTTTGASPQGAESVPESATAASSRTDRWIEILASDSAISEQPDLFAAAFEAVERTVTIDPRAADTVGRILEQRLRDLPLQQALATITDALRNYLGSDGVYLVHWLAYSEPSARLERVAAAAPERVTAFLRTLLAEHGDRIDLAQRISMGGTDDWGSIDKRAYVDSLTGRQLFVIQVSKLDGSVVRLECSANSLMSLTTHLIELINASQTMAVYASERLTSFMSALAVTIQLLDDKVDEHEAGTDGAPLGD